MSQQEFIQFLGHDHTKPSNLGVIWITDKLACYPCGLSISYVYEYISFAETRGKLLCP